MESKNIGRHVRQGDVLIVEDLSQPSTDGLAPVSPENGDTVLAHGEVTGHAHRIREGQGTELLESPGAPSEQERILHARQVSDAAGDFLEELAKVTHEEHGTVEIRPGTSRVIRQTEYVRQQPPRVVAD